MRTRTDDPRKLNSLSYITYMRLGNGGCLDHWSHYEAFSDTLCVNVIENAVVAGSVLL
jgi:hypothetical protein